MFRTDVLEAIIWEQYKAGNRVRAPVIFETIRMPAYSFADCLRDEHTQDVQVS